MAAGHAVAVRGGEDAAAAPGAVDVEPDVVLGAEGGEWGDRVVGAEDGGPGGRVEVEGSEALGFGGGDEAGEGGGVHGAGFGVDGDGADGGGADLIHDFGVSLACLGVIGEHRNMPKE